MDLQNETTQTLILAPIVKNADANLTEADQAGFRDLVFQVSVGASADTLSGSNYIELEVEHSDVSGSGFVDCADADIQSSVTGTTTGTFALINATDEDDTLYTVQYIGGKEFVRVVLNFTGTHTTGTPIGVVAVQSGENYLP